MLNSLQMFVHTNESVSAIQGLRSEPTGIGSRPIDTDYRFDTYPFPDLLYQLGAADLPGLTSWKLECMLTR